MTPKKPYSPPQLFQVELNQQQAILAQCNTGASGLSTLGTRGCQKSQNCRRSSTNNGNAGAAAS